MAKFSELKKKILNDLLARDVFIKKVSDIQYYTRCPYCGDTQKTQNDGHFYIRINPNDNFPIFYYCFKCPAYGVMSVETLELLGIDLSKDYIAAVQTMNKSSDKLSSHINEIKDIHFDYQLPDKYDRRKIQYMENRLGIHFTEKQLQDMKVITSFKNFLLLNNIKSVTCKPYIARLLEEKYIGFLTNNNSYILFRDTTEKENIRWLKYPITNDSRGQRIFYSIKSEIDLYTSDNIIINLSEGVMDCVSIAYNLDNEKENVLNIAVCGKVYYGVIRHLIEIGFIGENVIINIYSDHDYTDDTSVEHYRKTLQKFTYLVKEINVFYNTLYKDCGVTKDKILLQKEKL
jgi:hypothetical protein